MSGSEFDQGYWISGQGRDSRAGVVMIPDVWGLSDHYRSLGEGLANEGFMVLVVDPYRKTGFQEITSPEEALAWIDSIDDNLMLETLNEGIDFLHVKGCSRVGITGFCMGGQYALLAACSLGGLSACSPFYGMLRYANGLDRSKKLRSPLEAIEDLSCPLLGFYGDQDPIIPVSDVLDLEQRLSNIEQRSSIRRYAEAGHAFMNDTRPDMYSEEAAKDAWPRLIDFMKIELQLKS